MRWQEENFQGSNPSLPPLWPGFYSRHCHVAGPILHNLISSTMEDHNIVTFKNMSAKFLELSAILSKIELSRVMRKCVLFNMRTTKAQISLRICAVWSAPLLFTEYNISRFYSRNFKTLASFCGCAGWFVFDLVGNSQTCFVVSWLSLNFVWDDMNQLSKVAEIS